MGRCTSAALGRGEPSFPYANLAVGIAALALLVTNPILGVLVRLAAAIFEIGGFAPTAAQRRSAATPA